MDKNHVYRFILTAVTAMLILSVLWITAIPAGAVNMTNSSGPVNAPTDITNTSNAITATSGNVTISSFTPAVGNGGTQVVIYGTNFTAITSITIAGVAVMSYTVNSSTQITATVVNAAAGTTGKVVVTTSDGSATSASNFTYTNPPTVTSFTPNSGYAGMQIIITGTNLTGATSVTIAGIAASITEVSATQITATVGNGTVGVSGVITVTTPNGTASSSGAFSYISSSAPTISQFTPTSGSSGTQVTIYGTNLSTVTSVNFGAYPVSQIMAASSNMLIVTVGAGVNGNVYITVATTTGTVTSSSTFYYSGSSGTMPTITSLSTTTGSYGTNVLIYGTNLSYTTGVYFGGTAAQSYAIYSTYISAVVGYGSSGYVTLTSAAGIATSSAYFTYTGGSTAYTPTITSLSTTSGSFGTTVYIYGTNLNYATGVYFGGTAAQSYVLNSATQITALVGYGSSGYVTVTSTSYGTGTSTTYFTYSGSTGYAPTITAISTSTGSYGTTVYIYGSNLNYATGVYFGGTSAQSYSINSSTQITAIVGYGSTGYVTVTSQYGTGTSLVYFTYTGSTGYAPTISSLSTTSGGYGTTIYIYGTNLNYATAVFFGGTAAQSFSINSATQITAVVAYGSTGYVTITSTYGTGTSATYFTYTGSTGYTPTIISFSPTSGNYGTEVFIYGSNLSYVTGVYFGGTAAQSFTVYSGNITAMVGYGSSGYVTLTSAYGTATSTSYFNYTGSSSNVPTITSFTPNSAYAGLPVNITGTNFTGATSVTLAGIAANFTVNSVTQITATTGNGTVGTQGVITVTTPNGTGKPSSSFTYVSSSAPTISQFTPTSGSSGTQVTIYGTNLSTVTSVNFGAYPVSQIVAASSNMLIVTVGAGVNGNVYITVTTTSGTATSLSTFYYSGSSGTLPTITSLSTTTGSYGTNVLIYGTNLNYTTGVYFGGTAAQSYAIYSTYISAVVGYGSSGYVTLTSSAGTATSTSYFTYTGSTGYTPTITSISPTSGGYGTTVYIYGTNLNYATGVYFGGTAAQSYIINSASQITAVVGYGSTGYVTITSAYGTGTSMTYFTYTGSSTTPAITSFSPTSGGYGTVVYIYGVNFTGATAVSFGGLAAQNYAVNSSSLITAVVANGSSGSVRVITASGIASLGGFTYTSSTVTDGPIVLSPAAVGPVHIGQTFNLEIRTSVGSAQGVSGVDAYLNFDPAKLEVVDADSETSGVQLTPGSGLPVVMVNNADNTSGFINYSAGKVGAPFSTGNFTVAAIQFRALAETNPNTAVNFSFNGVRHTVVDYNGAPLTGAHSDATVTISNENALNISVSLQGGSRPAGGWIIPLTVKFFIPGVDVLSGTPVYTFSQNTYKSGSRALALCSGVNPGTYDITVISQHCLVNVKRGVAISTDFPTIDMGNLLEGNANNDEKINIQDFGVLAATYGKGSGDAGFNANADFDRSGLINISDFGLLALNYAKTSPVVVTVNPPVSEVLIKVTSPASVTRNATFDVSIDIGQVSGLVAYQIYLTYDSSRIQITGDEGGTGITSGLLGSTILPVDVWAFQPPGTPGKIGVLGQLKSGSVTGAGYLAKIHFQAIGAGQSSLTFSNTFIFNAMGEKIPSSTLSGSVMISGN